MFEKIQEQIQPHNESKAEKKETSVETKVKIEPISEALKKKYIRPGIVLANISAEAESRGLTINEYLNEGWRSVRYGNKEYLLLISRPETSEQKIFHTWQKEGPVIYIDYDIPRKFWDIILVHEISEIETWKKIRNKKGEHQQEKEFMHQDAVFKEDEYARRTRTQEGLEAYKKWEEEFRKTYARY